MRFAKVVSVLVGLVFVCGMASKPRTTTVRLIKSAPKDTRNSLYVSNREPLTVSPFVKLPIGSIEPRGWVRRMLELQAEGMVGHLDELSQWCKAEGNAWLSPEGKGHSPWEELVYWLKGYGDMGYVLGDEEIIKEARKWLDAILASQTDDGWFGPRSNKTKLGGEPDMWPNMIALNCLQSYYDYSGDERVIPFMKKYFRWQLSVPEEDFLTQSWQERRAGDNLASVYWLYNRTGDEWLLKLAEKIHKHTSNWTDGMASWHGVNIAQCFMEPAVYYMQAKEEEFKDAAERNYDTVRGIYGQVPGGMYGADENCRKGYYGPRQATETCAMVEFMHSAEELVLITGNAVWADRCEDVAFNSFAAALTPDMKALHYLTAPNLIRLDRFDKEPVFDNGGCMLAYSPWIYRCCQHNVSHGWPYYAENLWLGTSDNGICASLYAASKVSVKVGDGQRVEIEEKTEYPFGEEVEFVFHTEEPVRFAFYMRIPGWCEGAKIIVNGKSLGDKFVAGYYTAVERDWKEGDRVKLVLPAEISLKVWRRNNNCVSVSRGPLTYSLKIGEKWVRYKGETHSPEKWEKCSDADYKWAAYEVHPESAWNYALVFDSDEPADCFEVIKKDVCSPQEPFALSSVPIELRAKGKKVEGWREDAHNVVGSIPASPVESDERVEEIKLVPMGFARLRISAFPVAGKLPGVK